jgi:hypothetical protein
MVSGSFYSLKIKTKDFLIKIHITPCPPLFVSIKYKDKKSNKTKIYNRLCTITRHTGNDPKTNKSTVV